ncbi:MAG: hypothetical protein Q4G08_01625 [Capnocytophaga sp.]|nr:hypothetical protein [Capnocytophaga sp.]
MLFASNHGTPVKEIAVENLRCPLSNKVESMTLVLEKAEVYIWPLLKVVKKNYEGLYIQDATGSVVKRQYWTAEMHHFFREAATGNLPVENAGTKWTLFGKIWLAIIIGLVMFVAVDMTYEKLIKGSAKKELYAELGAFPQVGDRYYGSINILDSQGRVVTNGYTWVKIIETNAQDSTVDLQLSTGQALTTPNPKGADSEHFSEEKYHVKFNNSNKYWIHFEAKNFNFTCMANQDLEDAKLPVKE